MDQSRYSFFVLIIILFLGIFIRVVFLAAKSNLAHDEAISYICAAGRLDSYHRMMSAETPPYGVWTPAAEWKKYWTNIQPFSLTQIRSDLAHYDIHPPLYFWLLHFWALIFGVYFWTGSLLNIILEIIIAVVLCKIARDIFKEPYAVAVILSVWFLSPAVVETSGLARQYSLVTLWLVLMIYITLKLSNREKPLEAKNIIPLIIVTSAGFLTHYHFVIPFVSCVIFLVVKIGRRSFRRLLAILGGFVVSLVLFVVLHPEFHYSFRRHQPSAISFTWDDFADRWVRAAFAFGPYRFKDAINAEYEWFAIIAVGFYVFLFLLMIGIYVICRRNNISIISHFRNSGSGLKFMISMFFGLTSVIMILYFAGLSPHHAMGGRYLSLAWPFMGFVLIWILRLYPRKYKRMSITICLALVLLTYSFVIAEIIYARQRRLPESDIIMVDNAPNVVIDNISRGILPRLVWHLPNNTKVYTARQKDLMDRPDLWTTQLQSGSLYISQLSYDSNAEGREQILDVIRQNHQVQHLPRRLAGLGEVYRMVN